MPFGAILSVNSLHMPIIRIHMNLVMTCKLFLLLQHMAAIVWVRLEQQKWSKIANLLIRKVRLEMTKVSA